MNAALISIKYFFLKTFECDCTFLNSIKKIEGELGYSHIFNTNKSKFSLLCNMQSRVHLSSTCDWRAWCLSPVCFSVVGNTDAYDWSMCSASTDRANGQEILGSKMLMTPCCNTPVISWAPLFTLFHALIHFFSFSGHIFFPSVLAKEITVKRFKQSTDVCNRKEMMVVQWGWQRSHTRGERRSVDGKVGSSQEET